MPAMTIGLFALAIVLVGIAFLINEAVDDDGTPALSEADRFATQNAGRTQEPTQQGGAGGETQTPGGNGTPGNQTPGNQTPGATTTPGAGGDEYTVQAGDTCFGIAEENDVTLAELLEANDMTEDDCLTLSEGDTLTIPD
jgi:LysM repeat protein